MKERFLKILLSQYMVLPIFLVKLVIYYCLIDVNLLHNGWVLGSVLIFSVFYFALSDSEWKGHRLVFLAFYVLFSIVMFADSMYFNYYNQTVSVKQLWQAANVAKVPQSFIATLIPASFILILDIPIVYYFFRKREKAVNKIFSGMKKGAVGGGCALLVLLLAVNPVNLPFFSKINSVGFFSNHIRDIYLAAAEPWSREEIPEEEVLEAVGELTDSPEVQELVQETVEEFYNNMFAGNPNGMLPGGISGAGVSSTPGGISQGKPGQTDENQTPDTIDQPEEDVDIHVPADKKGYKLAEGRNLILVQIEALQSMMLQAEYEGQELMPNVNQLLKEDTLYFDRYYATIGKGNTADAEFATLNSLYPVIDRECYELYQTNTYDGLPWMLKERGYSTFGVHGYLGDFWNRNYAYPYQGIDEYYSIEDLDDSDQIGLGISDKSMFRQAAALMEEQEGPFFSFLVTLTNHHPYQLPEELSEIKLKEEHEGTKFGSYLQTVHYTDQAIAVLIEELKARDLYENSVLVFYGDHHGLNKNMDDNEIYVSEWLGREYDYDEMFRIPLIIHIPGIGYSETVSTLGGQIDFLPTIANLMDLELDHPYILGRDLYNAEEGFVAFTAYLFEGSFAKDGVMFEISREGLFEGSRAWVIGTGEELDIENYYEDYEKAVKLKQTSKDILEQDLISNHVSHQVTPYLPSEEAEDEKGMIKGNKNEEKN
ncbi:MAG: LTA synthase family protein [Lachnospiraceae bacterium]|jgi:hypothetical protein|nr:LTA synthase family protein [Lachnospiraceae bacterium]